jgi:hypothetical protein
VVAALDRCRSYRQSSDIECRIIALNDTLVTDDNPVNYERFKVSRIVFEGDDFLAGQLASLSYTADSTMGYIWLVDVGTGRDCKGEWKMTGDKATWWMVCQDGLEANGEMMAPFAGAGDGQGVVSGGKPVSFIYYPDIDWD